MFNGIIHTILVAFSMKNSRACTGMLSSENNDFKFLKLQKKKHKKACASCAGLMELFYLSKTLCR